MAVNDKSGADESNDSALPFNKSDVVNGIGKIERIVGLDKHNDEFGVSDGRCRRCGYDRGTYQSHTEIDEYGLHCRECEAKLGGSDE